MEQLELNFYNTIHLQADQLKQAVSKCSKQQEAVLKIFELMRKPMTPAQVHIIYNRYYHETPLTSIRRAITNLTHSGHLIKLNKQAPGKYGKLNYTWKYFKY